MRALTDRSTDATRHTIFLLHRHIFWRSGLSLPLTANDWQFASFGYLCYDNKLPLIVRYGSLFSRQIFMDLLLAFGSMATIAICICIQTQSFWITGFAVFGIFMSFMEANFVYRVILDYRYVKCISSIKVPLLAQFWIWSPQDDTFTRTS